MDKLSYLRALVFSFLFILLILLLLLYSAHVNCISNCISYCINFLTYLSKERDRESELLESAPPQKNNKNLNDLKILAGEKILNANS